MQYLEDDPDELMSMRFAEPHPEPPMARDEDYEWHMRAEQQDEPLEYYD